MVRVRLPGPLVVDAGGCARVEIEGPHATVREALGGLFERHPALRSRLVDDQGRVRPHVNVFVGSESIRPGRGLDTPLRDGAEIVVLPAVSGG